MKKDFIVNIETLTTSVSQKGFGTILILDPTADHPYTLYSGIEGLSEDFASATDVYAIASRLFGQSPAPQQVAVYGNDIATNTTTVTDALNELVNEHNDWFGLVCTDNTTTTIEELATWIDTQDKVYAVTSDDLVVYTNLASRQTFVFYHTDPTNYVAEGLLAYLLVREIGGVTGKFKTIAGALPTEVSDTDYQDLADNNINTYVTKMGVNQTTDGKMTDGEYIDVVLGEFFIRFRMEEELMMLAVNTPKIPYTNEGISMLKSRVEKVLKLATPNIIAVDEDGAGQYTIATVKKSDVASADVANRTYNGLTWEATLAGAIHEATINGTLVL